MIQKGQIQVQRVAPAKPVQVETVKAQTIKILTYRDQVEANWDEFTERPIKAVLEALPGLKICKVQGCHCPSWHPTADTSEPMLDMAEGFLHSAF